MSSLKPDSGEEGNPAQAWPKKAYDSLSDSVSIDQSLWDRAPIVPKTPPNPVKNDKEFLKEFPYLAEPW